MLGVDLRWIEQDIPITFEGRNGIEQHEMTNLSKIMQICHSNSNKLNEQTEPNFRQKVGRLNK